MKTEKKQMKFLDFFSGIGGFHTGLEKAGMKCIGYCEFDKFAQNSYKAIYDTEGLYFNNDIRTIKGKDLPKADLWTFGFPCQDISIAGSQTERVYDSEGISCTLMARGSTGTGLYKVNDGQNIRIRRLTPLESWRLQGFSDAQYEAAAAVTSPSQLHKQAGNAVTVNVVEEIGRHIIETNDFLDNLSIN